MEEASIHLSEILSKCKELNITPWHLKSSSLFINKHNFTLLKKDVLLFLATTIGIVLYCLSVFTPHSNQCFISLPDSIRKSFRPPVTCEFCQSVSNVRKVKMISRDDFENEFAYSGVPVVVTDATSNWTSLKETYDRAKHRQKILNCQFFPYKSGFKNLFDALKYPPEHFEPDMKAWYFGWSNCNSETVEHLRQHYGRPYFLPETSENNAVDWIFMGKSGLGAHMHVDNVRLPSWQAQLSGKKRWILMPPPECYFACMRMEVLVEEGDIIVLDTNKWYHQTIVLPGNISITIGAEYD